MMASFRSFLSRRQTDRTTLTFGSGVFLLKQFPQFFGGNLSTEESWGKQAEKLSCRLRRSRKRIANWDLTRDHPHNP